MSWWVWCLNDFIWTHKSSPVGWHINVLRATETSKPQQLKCMQVIGHMCQAEWTPAYPIPTKSPLNPSTAISVCPFRNAQQREMCGWGALKQITLIDDWHFAAEWRGWPPSSIFPPCVSQNPKSRPQLNEKADRKAKGGKTTSHICVEGGNLSCCFGLLRCSNRCRSFG